MVKTKKLCIFVLGLLALAATISATIVMVTSHESTKVYNSSFNAKYNDTPSFKLFVPPETFLGRVVVRLDVVVMLLLTSGISAALAIAYVGKKGDSYAGWLPTCG